MAVGREFVTEGSASEGPDVSAKKVDADVSTDVSRPLNTKKATAEIASVCNV